MTEASTFSAGARPLPPVRVIGGGLAGCQAALTLSDLGHAIELWEMRPVRRTPAHSGDGLAELVCSNSFKGLGLSSAHGLLKEELRLLGAQMIELAMRARVPAGESLAVDRDAFSREVEEALVARGIRIVRDEAVDIDESAWTVVAPGPLASDAIAAALSRLIGARRLAFFDAIAPIVSAESIDWEHAWKANRWDKGEGADFVNCPLDRETYDAFVAALVEADRVEPKPFEPAELFEGCLPIEEMARRGPETLRHGPLRPVGLTDPRTGRWPRAALQLRAENASATIYNLVGCQTRLRWAEQKRIFSMIPALRDAEFVRLGSMHRNSFVDSPNCLDRSLSVRNAPRVFLAGQITGAEGYTEAVATGLYAALHLHARATGGDLCFPVDTALGSLVAHLTTERPADAPAFQPMNFNFGLLPEATAAPSASKPATGRDLPADRPDEAEKAPSAADSAPPPPTGRPLPKSRRKELRIERALEATRALALALGKDQPPSH